MIEARAKFTRDEHGKAIMMYGLNRDESVEVELQNSLGQVSAKSLQSAKLALLGEMAGSITHEINKPHTIIHGKIEQTLRQLAKIPLDGERVESNLRVVLQTAERIAKIVRGLRTFARQADNDPLVLEDMQAILSDTLELCQERFRNSNVALRLEHPSNAMFLGRSAQISQVVMNMLSNSYDAVIDMDEKLLELEVGVESARVTVHVTDSGKGIPENVVDDLMQPFFTTTEVGKATGLGLSIAKSMADEHKANFYCDSESANTSFVLSPPRFITVAQGGGSAPESSTRVQVAKAEERGAA